MPVLVKGVCELHPCFLEVYLGLLNSTVEGDERERMGKIGFLKGSLRGGETQT